MRPGAPQRTNTPGVARISRPMATEQTVKLTLESREPGHSRDTRRLRSTGRIPGVLYGGDVAPTPITLDPANLRLVLLQGSALIDVELDGKAEPVIIKQTDLHPVRGNVTHVDLLRVDLTQPINADVAIELVGVDESPGVVAKGVLDHQLHSVTISALPSAIPESIVIDVSWMDLGDTFLLNKVETPEGVTIVSEHADEIAVVTVVASRSARAEGEEGEGDEAAEGDDAAAASEDA
jgi:large subunit ribosomal protein L25